MNEVEQYLNDTIQKTAAEPTLLLAEGTRDAALYALLKAKGFADVCEQGIDVGSSNKTVLGVFEGTYKPVSGFAAMLTAKIFGINVLNTTTNALRDALMQLQDTQEPIASKEYIDKVRHLQIDALVPKNEDKIRSKAECEAAPKILIEAELPDGVFQMNICTACASRVIGSGEGIEMYMDTRKIRVLLAALLGIMQQQGLEQAQVTHPTLQ